MWRRSLLVARITDREHITVNLIDAPSGFFRKGEWCQRRRKRRWAGRNGKMARPEPGARIAISDGFPISRR